jgi:uncharacterized protein (TIGR04255 family)
MIDGHETFAKAPIEEALLDFRVERSLPVDSKVVDPFLDAVSTDFPNREPRVEFESRLEFDAHGIQKFANDRRVTGWVLKSGDGRHVIQPTVNGLTVSQLKPYSRWEDLLEIAQRLWGIYAQTSQPVSLTRISTRFINRIVIPASAFRFDEWFQTGPMLGTGVPDQFTELLMRMVVRDAEGTSAAAVTLMTQPPDELSRTPVVFDIETFMPVSLSPTDGSLWGEVAKLRDFKNRVFFGSITDKTKELFR